MYVPMIDNALEIQPAVTKTASFNGPALDMGQGFAPGGLGKLLAAVVDVSAIDRTDANETYAFKLQESADGATAWADIGLPVSVAAAGNTVAKAICTGRFIRLVLTAGGTTPSITYTAHVGL